MRDAILAVSRLEHELHAAGVPHSAAIPTLFTYISALQDRNDETWRAFYRSVHARLCELAAREYPYAGPSVEPLLRLLDDDLGATLISDTERARIRARLVEDGRSEANLPS